ncbi:MAG TPA: hypothetical protein VI431_07040 [Candidatus Acidoferrum sp.]
MTAQIVDLLQAVQINEEQKQPAAGPASEFQLAFRQSIKAAAIIKPRQFVNDCKILQLHLEHELFRSALNGPRKEFLVLSLVIVPWARPWMYSADISEQGRQFLISIRNEGLKGRIQILARASAEVRE